jgi:hypothetical protein
MLVCVCKNPGFIGNENLLGNCSTPFICDGKVVDINKPLNEIECKCPLTDINVRYDNNVPGCKELLIKEANEKYFDYTDLIIFNSSRQLNIEHFNPTVRDNLKTKHLLDPCKNSLHDTTVQIIGGYFDGTRNVCNFFDSGFPVSNGLLDFKPVEMNGSEKFVQVSSDGGFATDLWDFVRMTDNIGGQQRMYGIGITGIKFYPPLAADTNQYVLVPPNGLSYGDNEQLYMTNRNTLIAPRCLMHPLLTYRCRWSFKEFSIKKGVPIDKPYPVPSCYLWSRQDWIDAENYLTDTIQFTKKGISLKNKPMLKMRGSKPFAIKFTRDALNVTTTLVFVEESDFQLHKDLIDQ